MTAMAHPGHFLLIYGLEPANKTAGDIPSRQVKGLRHQSKQGVLPKEPHPPKMKQLVSAARDTPARDATPFKGILPLTLSCGLHIYPTTSDFHQQCCLGVGTAIFKMIIICVNSSELHFKLLFWCPAFIFCSELFIPKKGGGGGGWVCYCSLF